VASTPTAWVEREGSVNNSVSNLLAVVGVLLLLVSCLYMGAGFREDGLSLQAFDTGDSPYWGGFMTFCPAAVLLLILSFLLVADDLGF
jgi:hypothetical protein